MKFVIMMKHMTVNLQVILDGVENVKFEKVDSKCVRVYGNYDGFSVVRESEQENYVEVDGRLMDYEDFEDWLYGIKQ